MLRAFVNSLTNFNGWSPLQCSWSEIYCWRRQKSYIRSKYLVILMRKFILRWTLISQYHYRNVSIFSEITFKILALALNAPIYVNPIALAHWLFAKVYPNIIRDNEWLRCCFSLSAFIFVVSLFLFRVLVIRYLLLLTEQPYCSLIKVICEVGLQSQVVEKRFFFVCGQIKSEKCIQSNCAR